MSGIVACGWFTKNQAKKKNPKTICLLDEAISVYESKALSSGLSCLCQFHNNRFVSWVEPFVCAFAGHRFAELPGMRRSKIAKRKGTLHSIVHIGKAHKEKRERLKKRTFDHSPHEVICCHILNAPRIGTDFYVLQCVEIFLW